MSLYSYPSSPWNVSKPLFIILISSTSLNQPPVWPYNYIYVPKAYCVPPPPKQPSDSPAFVRHLVTVLPHMARGWFCCKCDRIVYMYMFSRLIVYIFHQSPPTGAAFSCSLLRPPSEASLLCTVCSVFTTVFSLRCHLLPLASRVHSPPQRLYNFSPRATGHSPALPSFSCLTWDHLLRVSEMCNSQSYT